MPVNVQRSGAASHTQPRYGEVSWDRMVRAVEKVRQRLQRAAAALEAAGIPYAVAGGNAVAAWVSRVDEAAVRNTQDVDIVLRRADLQRAIAAMTEAGLSTRTAPVWTCFSMDRRAGAGFGPRRVCCGTSAAILPGRGA